MSLFWVVSAAHALGSLELKPLNIQLRPNQTMPLQPYALKGEILGLSAKSLDSPGEALPFLRQFEVEPFSYSVLRQFHVSRAASSHDWYSTFQEVLLDNQLTQAELVNDTLVKVFSNGSIVLEELSSEKQVQIKLAEGADGQFVLLDDRERALLLNSKGAWEVNLKQQKVHPVNLGKLKLEFNCYWPLPNGTLLASSKNQLILFRYRNCTLEETARATIKQFSLVSTLVCSTSCFAVDQQAGIAQMLVKEKELQFSNLINIKGCQQLSAVGEYLVGSCRDQDNYNVLAQFRRGEKGWLSTFVRTPMRSVKYLFVDRRIIMAVGSTKMLIYRADPHGVIPTEYRTASEAFSFQAVNVIPYPDQSYLIVHSHYTSLAKIRINTPRLELVGKRVVRPTNFVLTTIGICEGPKVQACAVEQHILISPFGERVEASYFYGVVALLLLAVVAAGFALLFRVRQARQWVEKHGHLLLPNEPGKHVQLVEQK